jgi:1,4-alpha-glucan branching enzyme
MIRRQRKGSQVRVTFALPNDHHDGTVSVVGDFNTWTPGVHTLVRRANGTRSVAVTLPAGSAHRFRYLGEGGRWFDDPDVERRDHEDGIIVT